MESTSVKEKGQFMGAVWPTEKHCGVHGKISNGIIATTAADCTVLYGRLSQ